MIDPYIDMASVLVSIWRAGPRYVRVWLGVSVALFAVGATSIALGQAGVTFSPIARGASVAAGTLGAVILITLIAYARVVKKTAQAERIEEVERRVQADPKATQAAWELAQVKLESYLSRNLQQVRSIYWLILFVMSVGFALIGYGVFKVYQAPENLQPSIVSSVSGILVSFIGASFLVIYRSTMAQAKDYVTILERINAVGMAIHILNSIEEPGGPLRKQGLADIARELLTMYQVRPPQSGRTGATSVRGKTRVSAHSPLPR